MQRKQQSHRHDYMMAICSNNSITKSTASERARERKGERERETTNVCIILHHQEEQGLHRANPGLHN